MSGSTREEMFTFLQDIFVRGVSIIEDGKPIPLPEDVSITSNNEVSQEISSQLSKLSSTLSNVSVRRNPFSFLLLLNRSYFDWKYPLFKTTNSKCQSSLAIYLTISVMFTF